MRRYLGAWLCLALGAVLITTGLSTGGTGSIGAIVLTPCAPTEPGIANPCPTAVVTVNETTSLLSAGLAPDATPPAGGWTIHVTSTCTSTVDGSHPMDESFTVPDGGSGSSPALYAYPDTNDSTKCSYTLTEDPVTGFTAAWDPANTFTLTVENTGIAENASVNLTNSATATTPTAAPSSTTVTRSSSASPTKTTSRSSTPTRPQPSASPSGSTLASTGPRTRTDLTLIVGIAVFGLGLVLLFAGRVGRRRGEHLG